MTLLPLPQQHRPELWQQLVLYIAHGHMGLLAAISPPRPPSFRGSCHLPESRRPWCATPGKTHPVETVPGRLFLLSPKGCVSVLVAQMVKNPPAMWETWVRSLGREDDLEEGMATHSSIFVWRIPMDRGAWWATVHGVAKSQTRLSN